MGKKYYYDFSSLDYTINFLKMDGTQAIEYKPDGVCHGPFKNMREAKRHARDVIKHYLTELKSVYDDIKHSVAVEQ